MLPIVTRLAGVTYGDAQENIKKIGHKDLGYYTLTREPYNIYDPNAIAVSYLNHYHLGYIPRIHAQHLAPMMDAGMDLVAEFISQNRAPEFHIIGLTVQIIKIA